MSHNNFGYTLPAIFFYKKIHDEIDLFLSSNFYCLLSLLEDLSTRTSENKVRVLLIDLSE